MQKFTNAFVILKNINGYKEKVFGVCTRKKMLKNKRVIIDKKLRREIRVRVLVPLLLFAVLLISVSYVSAYQRLCLGYGESIPGNDYVCWHTQCQVCVTDLMNPTHPNHCADIVGCSAIDEGSVDVTPPELTINSPAEGEVYDSRKVLFDITSNEPASFYYIDNIDGRGRWKRLASNVQEIFKGISFKDGFNDITIKAVDRNGNEAFYAVTFYVDSKEPKMKKSYPAKGFANGDFSVEFVEENPANLVLYYGVEGDMREKAVDIENNCVDDGKSNFCNTNVNLNDFDGNIINYYFELEDMAGNFDQTDSVSLGVDITPPVINSLDYEKDGKKVYFTIDIDENFLEEVYYSYEERGRIKEKKLCSDLKEGVCEGKASFKDGEWDVDIVVLDQAGNAVSQSINFLIDSKVPKLKKTYPAKGFANGEFSVEFVEGSPVSSNLYYGIESDMRDVSVDLGSCIIDEDKYLCDVSVDLADFDGLEIVYWFDVEDAAGNVEESKEVLLDVDITPPVLLNENSFWEQGDGRKNKYIYFDLEINEDNLDEVNYIDWSDSRPKWKKLCSRLKEGHCIKKKSFKKGMHDVDVQITDEAGNAVSYSLDDFEVE